MCRILGEGRCLREPEQENAEGKGVGLHGKRINKKFLITILMIWAVQMAAAFCFCVQKQGFHEDEYYTYYSTARTNGFYVENGQWMDRETYRNEFVVLPGQGFQYGLVKLVQSWDVHPPVYYWVFHTVASLVPGVFSKWIGLSVNLVFWGINIVLLTDLAWLVSGRNKETTTLITLFYGLSPAALSGVVFIRMYEMLTTFVLLCAILHMWAVAESWIGCEEIGAAQDAGRGLRDRNPGTKKPGKLPVLRCLLPMAVVTYLGFLTQYYYFIFLFYLAAAFGIWLIWRDRNLRNCLRYGVCQGIAFVLAWMTYPSCLGQMFRGQRGAQAAENFFDVSNTLDRFRFFCELLDEYVFGNLLPVVLLLVLILAVTVYWQRSRHRIRQASGKDLLRDAELTAEGHDDGFRNQGISAGCKEKGREGFGTGYVMLAFAVLGYFLTVSKTALLLGDTSNRYQLPVYGMIVLLLFQGIRMLWQQAKPAFKPDNVRGKYLFGAAAAVCLLIDAAGLAGGRVVFLYPEDREQTDFAVERAKEGTQAVYLYEPGAEWCIWDVTNELLAYPEVYFAAADETDRITEEKIQNADALGVYLADGADDEAQLGRILDSNPGLSDGQLMFEEKYCRVYYVQ